MFLLLVLLAVCAATDLEEDRIPNWICFTGGVVGLIVGWSQEGIMGLKKRFIGIVIMMAILLPFWIWKIIGGGDSKLFMMAACYLGLDTRSLLLWSFVIAGIHSVCIFIMRKNFRERMGVFRDYCRNLISSGIRKPYPFNRNCAKEKQEGGIHISYSALIGYMVYLFVQYIPPEEWF